MRGVVTALIAFVGGCVNLSPPSILVCGPDNRACGSDAYPRDAVEVRPRDFVDTGPPPPDVNITHDAVTPDGGVDALPGPVTDASVVTPVDTSVAPSVDAPPDLTADTPPDMPPDRPIDTPVDLPPDLPPDAGPTVSCPAESSLLICLRFEGNLIDESAPAATLTSSNVTFETGNDAQAVRLGTSSLLRASAGWGNINNDLTLEAWVRIDRMPTGSERAGILDEESHFGLFVLPGGTVNCSSSSGDATATNALTVGQWAAISCTLQGTSLVLWINGIQQDQAQTDGLSNGPTATLGIGGNLPSGDAFEGLMDNVRIWNRARTAQEICDYSPTCP